MYKIPAWIIAVIGGSLWAFIGYNIGRVLGTFSMGLEVWFALAWFAVGISWLVGEK